jgi:surface carbohydrate biosynthesis protein
MPTSRPSLILPVESQLRELDPKLLLACVAATRGFRVFLGSRTRIDFRIAAFPRSLYLCKSMTPRSIKMFRIMRELGHEIGVWDEEALVHPAPQQYYQRRLSAEAMRQVSMLFAWGEENAELFRKYPEYPGTPIHVTGNPRIDMLRPELEAFHREEADRIRARFGDFVLVNTNFAMVNAFLPTLNLLQSGDAHGGAPATGAFAVGWERDFVEALAAHKRALFEHFQALLPRLAAAFPERTIVVRPHPTEDRAPWETAAAPLRNVEVVAEGGIAPWLSATRALVHNGCTTAIEAFIMRVPAVAYRPVRSERCDNHFPNAVSHEARDFESLRTVLRGILEGRVGPAAEPGQRALVDHHIAAREGALASDRIADVLEERWRREGGLPHPGVASVLRGWLDASRRSFVKQRIKSRKPGHRNNPDYQRHRFQGVSLDELRARIGRLDRALGRFARVEARRFCEDVFELLDVGSQPSNFSRS